MPDPAEDQVESHMEDEVGVDWGLRDIISPLQIVARIAALEGAIASLRMREEESEDEEPMPPYQLPVVPTWDQVGPEPQQGGELVVTFVVTVVVIFVVA